MGSSGYNTGNEIDPTDSNSANYTAGFTGTSSATPKVAGVVALMVGANPDLTPSQAKTILRCSADDIEGKGVDDRTGAGRVNAERAVEMAKRLIQK